MTYGRANNCPTAGRSRPARQAQGGRRGPLADVFDRGWLAPRLERQGASQQGHSRHAPRKHCSRRPDAGDRPRCNGCVAGDGGSGLRRAASVILVDVNVLIYAFRRDTAHHAVCKPWLDNVIGGDARFGMAPLALCAVARLATNPRIFKSPSSIEEAFAFCENLLSQPHCEAVWPGERHWTIFKRLCIETGTRGPRITDAWFAALAIEHGCTWITCDRDYARFPGLNWKGPAI